MLAKVTPRTALWMLLPVVVGLLGELLLVRPAELQQQLAQQNLLRLEREELAATLAAEREELAVKRMQERIEVMHADAERMRVSEEQALVEIARLQKQRMGKAPSAGHWLMPHQEPITSGPDTPTGPGL